MNTIIIYFYPLLCIVIPSLIYQLISVIKGRRMTLFHWLLTVVFMVYLAMVMQVTGFGTIWEIGNYDTVLHFDNINLHLFDSAGASTYLLNLVMFMPLGFLLPQISRNFHRFWRVTVASFGFSLTIELSQLLNLRCCDVDDLLMNTVGGIAGYLLWFILSGIFHLRKDNHPQLSSHEGTFYIVIAVLSQFFCYHWRFFA